MKKWLWFIVCLFVAGCAADVSGYSRNLPVLPKKDGIIISPLEDKNTWAQKVVANMTIEELVGQLFIISYRRDLNNGPAVQIDETLQLLLEEYAVGGVILFSENIQTQQQLQGFISDMQQSAQIPLWIAIDEEGGRVSRLAKLPESQAPRLPSAQVLSLMSEEDIKKEAGNLGAYLASLGVNVDFAPIADINTNPLNQVIGDRAFGSTPEEASKGVRAFVAGLEENNVASCLKHFPGHGDTREDSHMDKAYGFHDLERLSSFEWVPFQQGIQQGATFVMMGHIAVPEIDPSGETAIFSKELYRLLREDLCFTGLIVTDAMDMQAVTKYYSSAEASVRALEAGADIILMPADFYVAYEGVLAAVKAGDISREMLEAKVMGILQHKYSFASNLV